MTKQICTTSSSSSAAAKSVTKGLFSQRDLRTTGITFLHPKQRFRNNLAALGAFRQDGRMTNAIDLIKNELDRRQKHNPRYSLRAFARHLDVSPAQLSQLLNGRRPLTPALANKIAEKLDFSPVEQKEFVSSTVLSKVQGDRISWQPMDEDRFQLISDWKHCAVLSLTKIRGARGDAGWVAMRLGLTYAEARDVLERLRRVGLIPEDPADFRQIDEAIHVLTNAPSAAVRRMHRQILDLSQQRLEDVPYERRDYSSMFISMRESDLEKLRERILKFQEEIASEAERGPGSDVYVLACQLFPVTKEVSS